MRKCKIPYRITEHFSPILILHRQWVRGEHETVLLYRGRSRRV